MNVIDRIREMATAAWHDLTEGTGHPERAVEAYLEAGRKQLAETERLYQQKVDQVISLREQRVNAEQLAEKRGEQAFLAMRAGEEELAMLVLQEKRHAEAVIEHTGAQYEQCQEAILELADELVKLRAAYAEAADQRDVYAARIESARLQQKLHRHGEAGAGAGATGTLKELQQTGLELGRELSEALCEFGRAGRETLIEAGHNVKQELREVREKLQRDWPNRGGDRITDTFTGKKAE